MSEQSSVPIAQSEFVIASTEQTEVQSRIRIWQPQPQDTDSWGCRISIDGILSPKVIIGEDSFQALCLAISFAHNYLKAQAAKPGLKIKPKYCAGTSAEEGLDSEYLNALFGR